MVYQIPELSEEDVFPVEYRGVTYNLPLLQNISLDAVGRLSDVTDDPSKISLENIRDVVMALDPEFAKVVGGMSAGQLLGLFNALKDASSVSLGESAPSVESSSSTEQP